MTATNFRQGACMPLQSLSCWLVDKNTKIDYLMRMNSGNLPTSQVEEEAQNTWKFPVSSKDIYVLSQSCLTLCDPMDCSPLGTSVHGDSPGRNMGVGCQCPPPGDLPNLGIEPRSPALQVDSSLYESPYIDMGGGRKKQVVWLQSSASSHYWDCILKMYINPPGPKSMWNAYFLYSFPVEHLYLWP